MFRLFIENNLSISTNHFIDAMNDCLASLITNKISDVEVFFLGLNDQFLYNNVMYFYDYNVTIFSIEIR